jgi:mRNA interferase MazF
MPTYPIPRRGEVWQVSLDPTVGHEVKKTRPAVIVTNDLYNANNWVVSVVPLTSRDTAEYDQVLIRPPEGGLTNTSVTLPDQLRAVDRARLVAKLGDLQPATLQQIDQSLRIVLDL